MKSYSRRHFFKDTISSLGLMTVSAGGMSQLAAGKPFIDYRSLKLLGPLGSPNEVGLRLPASVTGRELARSGHRVVRGDGEKTDYRWHIYPDGGACFPTDDGGWIYTSNCEVRFFGGVGAIRFNHLGEIVDAYSILSNTSRNCAGGPTPWGTWLSCEEVGKGYVYECDIYGREKGQKRKALGAFRHEAVAIDPIHQHAYLTEDESDGRLYRFTPDSVDASGRMNFDEGILEVAMLLDGGRLDWQELENPTPGTFGKDTRKQVPESQAFDGGEGIWFHEGLVYFTTKGDNRVWSYDTNSQILNIVYDEKTSAKPILQGVDNVVVSADGHILVAEDGGDMQIVVLGPYGDIYPLVQVVDQNFSEVTGPAINHLGNRIYFSSQRAGGTRLGITYELEGLFVNP